MVKCFLEILTLVHSMIPFLYALHISREVYRIYSNLSRTLNFQSLFRKKIKNSVKRFTVIRYLRNKKARIIYEWIINLFWWIMDAGGQSWRLYFSIWKEKKLHFSQQTEFFTFDSKSHPVLCGINIGKKVQLVFE